MKQIFKYALMLLTAGVIFTACQDDEEISRATVSGAQVFFSNDLPAIQELSKSNNSFTIPVTRANVAGAVTVPITVDAPDGSIYNVPSSISFADGDTIANLVITYDPDQLNYGEYTDLAIQIADSTYTTPYGDLVYQFSAGATAWVSMGMATYVDDLVAGTYGASPVTYQVEMQKNIVEEGIYRLVNPYGADYPYNDPGDWDTSKDYYMVIDATDPDYVWVPVFETGLNWGDGAMSIASFVQLYLDNGNSLAAIKANLPEYFGTLEDGIITFPTSRSFLAGFDGAYDEYYSNNHGAAALAFPGHRLTDYSVNVSYKGRFIDVANNVYAQVNAVLGSDVTGAKAALATEDNFDEVLTQLEAGETGVDVVSGQDFLLPFQGSSTYYILVTAFDDDGEVVNEVASRVKLDDPNDTQEEQINWEAAFIGDYFYGLFSSEDDEEIDEDLTLYRDADNTNHYRIAPWMDENHSLEFVLNEDGSITVPEQGTGFDYDGELFIQDVQSYTNHHENYAQYVSNYSEGVFTLYLVYYNDAHQYLVADSFTLTGNADVKKQAPDTHKVLPLNFKTKPFRFVVPSKKFVQK